jgi:hypothetical protein
MKYIIVFALLLSGCASTPVEKLIYVTAPLTLPGRPTLPTFSASNVECLSTETKQKILTRDRMRKDYSIELETIIQSTNK